MKYPAISNVSRILSWILAGVFFLSGLAGAIYGHDFPSIFRMFVIWAVGFVIWLALRFLPELLQVLINIERNTENRNRE